MAIALASIKRTIRPCLDPLRGPITWACQRGLLSSRIREYLPWRWPRVDPFTIYGNGWRCRWFPTEFDDIGVEIFWSGLRHWETETIPVVLANIQRSRCFIDIGANCGIYTVFAAITNPTIRCIAIEPVPKVCAALARNVRENNLNSRVLIMKVAVGDSNGVVGFHEAQNATMGSLELLGYQGQSGSLIQVQCRTLDSIVEELSVEPDFIKIDVEGFEHAVLAGASRVLHEFRPCIVLEANPGDPYMTVTEILKKYEYRVHLITDDGVEPRAEIFPDSRYRNWLCVPAP